jgi:hypothetical protein
MTKGSFSYHKTSFNVRRYVPYETRATATPLKPSFDAFHCAEPDKEAIGISFTFCPLSEKNVITPLLDSDGFGKAHDSVTLPAFLTNLI